jgi:hypothetical protein
MLTNTPKVSAPHSSGAAPRFVAARASSIAREARPGEAGAASAGEELGRGPRYSLGGVSVYPRRDDDDARGIDPVAVAALSRLPIARKAVRGSASDPLEHEADDVADRVMRSAPAGATVAAGDHPPIQMKRAAGRAADGGDRAIALQALGQRGMALPAEARSFFEPRFGHDFSRVRVHAGDQAAHAAHAVGARAFTFGNDIVFGAGEYAPAGPVGRRLLAHELAHVVQQGAGAGAGSPARTVQKQEKDDEAAASKPKPAPEWKTVERLYAVVFPRDVFGQNALAFVRKYHPQHKILRPSSFQELFDLLKADIATEAAAHRRLHVDQLMIVTHANRRGGLFAPIRRADVGNRAKFFTPENVAALQRRILEKGEDKAFEETRHQVVTRAFDERSEIIVRGCEFGRDPQAADVLSTFFGGSATVWAPTDYQGYGPNRAGAPTSYYVRGSNDDDATENDKTRLVALERAGKAFSPEAEALRMREEYVEIDAAGKRVVSPRDVDGAGRSAPAGTHWRRIDSVPEQMRLKDIEAEARLLLSSYTPENATRLRALRRAWMESRERREQILADTSGAGAAGMQVPEEIFGDPMVIDRDAEAHPRSADAFKESSPLDVERGEAEARQALDFSESQALGDPGRPIPEALRPPRAVASSQAAPAPAPEPAAVPPARPAPVAEPAVVPPAPPAAPRSAALPEVPAVAPPPAAPIPAAPAREPAVAPPVPAAAPRSAALPEVPAAAPPPVAPAPAASAQRPAADSASSKPPANAAPAPAPRPAAPKRGGAAVPPAAPARRRRARSRGRSGSAAGMVFPLDYIFSRPEATDPARSTFDVGPDESSAVKPELAIAARGQFKRTFAIPIAKKIFIFKSVEAEIAFEGTLAFAGEGKKQLNLGAFGALGTKTGERTQQSGGRVEIPIAKDKNKRGALYSVKAGAEGGPLGKTTEVEGDPVAGAGRKLDVYISGETGWGPVSAELKVTLFGYDSSKKPADQIKVLELKVSPIVLTQPIEIPCTDGTTATFTGKTSISIKGEPDWPDIAARLAKRFGHAVAVDAGAVAGAAATGGAAGVAASGGTAAGSTATGSLATETATAIGAGEALLTLGFASVAAATIYAYVQDVQDAQDLKKLGADTSAAVDDFVAGFLAGCGYRHGAASGGRLYNLGLLYGRQELDMALERSRRRFQSLGYQFSREEEAEIRDEHQVSLMSDSTVPARVKAAFEPAIRGHFYLAFKKAQGARYDTPAGELEIRAATGVRGDPETQPDWSLIFDRTGPRKPRPGRRY